jgi:hypothetical protein
MAYGAATQPAPNNLAHPAGVQFPYQVLDDDGAITISNGIVELTKSTASAITLADPDANGLFLAISSKTAAAHTVTISSGLHGLGASENVCTFGGAIDDCIFLASARGYWVQVANVNVTVA